ncbi:MAG: hypothetical protein IPN32_30050 [Deltaproteobacteria bacterium]|nr:hypothetical protein [Deltaproteobacteria bacterium]
MAAAPARMCQGRRSAITWERGWPRPASKPSASAWIIAPLGSTVIAASSPRPTSASPSGTPTNAHEPSSASSAMPIAPGPRLRPPWSPTTNASIDSAHALNSSSPKNTSVDATLPVAMQAPTVTTDSGNAVRRIGASAPAVRPNAISRLRSAVPLSGRRVFSCTSDATVMPTITGPTTTSSSINTNAATAPVTAMLAAASSGEA